MRRSSSAIASAIVLVATVAAAQGARSRPRLLSAGMAPATFNVQSGGIAACDVTLDDQGHVTKKTYDTLGRLRSQDDPDRGSSAFAYNGFDELKQTVHAASGETESLVYDDLGRVIQRSTADGVSTFVFDASPFGVGQASRGAAPR